VLSELYTYNIVLIVNIHRKGRLFKRFMRY